MTGRNLLPKLGLALIASGLAFAVCELGARMIFPRPPIGTREPQIGHLHDPEIRYVLAPNQTGWIDDGLVSINSLGFRGPEVVLPKPPGRFRVAVAGDSLTLGWGVGNDETYASRLEQLLRGSFPEHDLDVINLGVGGYGTRQEVTLLARHAARLQPDLVLIGFYSNDVPDALDDNQSPVAGGTRIATENPEAGRVLHMNPTPSGWWNRQLRKSRAIYLAGRAFNRVRGAGEWGMSRFAMELEMLEGKTSPDLERAWGRVARQFDRLGSLASTEKFAVGIVVLPCREQVTGQYLNARYQKTIRSLAEPLGFHVIDPLPVMRESRMAKQELFIPYDRNHPSPEGHALIAQAILEYIDEHDLIVTTPRPSQAGPAPAMTGR